MTYPGSIPFRRRPRGLVRETSLVGLVVGLLFGFGYLTGYHIAFVERVLAAWVLGTPVAI